MSDLMTNQKHAAQWAYNLLQRNDFCILDTETTGLKREAQTVQLGVLAPDETVLLDTLVRPTVEIEAEATLVHGITHARLKAEKAPRFDEVLLPLLKAVGKRDVVIYGAEFDIRMIRQSIKPYGIQLTFPTRDRRNCRIFLNGGSILDAMLWYSQWVGEDAEREGDYKWQKLPGGDHTAIGDCKAVLQIIKQMADDWERTIAMKAEPQPARSTDNAALTATAPTTDFDDIPF